MTDYTYDRYSEAMDRMAELAYRLWRNEHKGTYEIAIEMTEEIKEQAQLLQQYQDYEQKNCMMWRPWETHVGYALNELRNTDGFTFVEHNGKIMVSWVGFDGDDSEEETEVETRPGFDDVWKQFCSLVERHEASIVEAQAAAGPAPAPIKIRRA